MHKHHKGRKSGRRSGINRNQRIPESATKLIGNLHTLIGVEYPDDPAVTYLRAEYLSKFCDESLTPAAVRRSAAISKWLSVEEGNAVTNLRLSTADQGFNILPRVSLQQFCKFARKLVATILGPLRDSIVVGSFSGGASTSRRRLRSTPAFKFDGKADMTGSIEILVDTIYREIPLLRKYGYLNEFNIVEGAKLFTVPKKTDIDRCACKEPDINMFLQKGVGKHIARRLKRFGIDLSDQSANRNLARQGARDSSLATLDLSSASDTMTIELVRMLLPHEWFEYCDSIRSQLVEVDGTYRQTQMFSSMGNGFTFELESLLFYVLTRTTLYFEGIPGIVSVYGDDIICPSRGFDMVTFVLSYFGFKTNPTKSFASGPFRESCGGHYWNTTDVTPFYLKSAATRLTDVIRVANQLRRWATADPGRSEMLPSTYTVWNQLASFVPKVLWGGRDLGSDTSLVSPGGPNKQLVRLSTRRNEPMLGSYLHFHNSFWNRATDPAPRAKPVSTSQKCVVRKARHGATYLTEQFYEELISRSVPG